MLGFALCGGGMKCAAHLGILQVMEELGVRPTLLSGSSMGAVVASIYASGAHPKEAADWFCRIRMSDVFVGGVPVPGLNHGPRLHRLLTGLFGNQRVEDLRIPVLIPACDLISGTTQWIDKGSLADALYASCALPGFFAPFATGQSLLGDGCLSEPLPAKELRNRGAVRVIGFHFPHVSVVGRKSLLPLAFRSLEILLAGLSKAACMTLDLSIQPPIGRRSGLWWNKALTEHYIDVGRKAALQSTHELIPFRSDPEGDGYQTPASL